MMNETELHSEYLWTSALTFNTSMTKKEINEKSIKAGNAPEASTILGDKAGATHRWVIGNEAGEVLPRFLMQKFIVIEVIFLPLSAEPHFACTGTLTDIPPPHHVCCAVRRAYHSQTYRLHTTYAAQYAVHTTHRHTASTPRMLRSRAKCMVERQTSSPAMPSAIASSPWCVRHSCVAFSRSH